MTQAAEAEVADYKAEIERLQTENARLQQFKPGKSSINENVDRAFYFNEMWKYLHYMSKMFPQLRGYKHPERDQRNDDHADVRVWLRENMPEIEKLLYKS